MNASLPWHPMAAHFPLALVATATLVLSLARLKALGRHATSLAIVGTWDLCLGALGALAALATGLAAVIHFQPGGPARVAISVHVKWAIFSTIALLLLAAWRGAGTAEGSPPSRLFLVLLWAVTAALIVTGYRGGENVYRYGIGVTHIEAGAQLHRQE